LRQLNGNFLGESISGLELEYISDRCLGTISITREINGQSQKSIYEVTGCPIAILKNKESSEQYYFVRNNDDNSLFLIEHEYESDGIAYEDQTTFYYEDGKLDYVNYYIKNATTRATMIYPNSESNNPSFIEYYIVNGGGSFRLGYEYDDYNSPFHTLPELALLFDQFGINNVTRVTRESGASIEIISRFTYQYNSQRYPTSISKNNLATTTLSYNCQ
jgi:hypothetical protein